MAKGLIAFAHDHVYLVTLVFCLSLLMAGFFGSSARQRRVVLLSGVLALPASLSALDWVPEYWRPQVLWDLPVSLEDVAFTFVAGGLAWLLVAFPWGGHLVLPPRLKPSLKRYSFGALGILSITGLLKVWGCDYFWALTVAIYGLGLILLRFLRPFWPLACWGGIAYLVLHFLVLKTAFLIWPHFLQQWNLPAIRGFIFGVPLEELVWALGFGFTWPLYMAYVFNVQVPER
jgi:hypothetical protein